MLRRRLLLLRQQTSEHHTLGMHLQRSAQGQTGRIGTRLLSSAANAFSAQQKRNPIVQAISVQKYILQEAEEELCLATKHTLFVTLWQATSGIVLHILPPVQYYSNIIRIHY